MLTQTLILVSTLLITFVSVKKWKESKSAFHFMMMLGGLVITLWIISIMIAPHFHTVIEVSESGSIKTQMTFLDELPRYLLPGGFLLFSIGFALPLRRTYS